MSEKRFKNMGEVDDYLEKQIQNEKRFVWKTEKLQHSDDEVLLVVDNENKEWKGHILNIVDLLNEQQEFIEELQVSDEMGWKRAKHFEKKCPKELHNKKMYIKRLEYKVQKFKKDIEELGISIKLFEDDIATKDKKIEEQQATIRKLQDLCGESDGENAKLRIENKKLKDDLHNCRLNKNIIREKLKLWQDVHKEYGIYSINDFEELMKNDK